MSKDITLSVHRGVITASWTGDDGKPKHATVSCQTDSPLTYPDEHGSHKCLRTFVRLADYVAKAVQAGKIAGLLLAALMLVGCALPVRAYPPRNAEGQPTPLPVTMAKPNGAPVEPGFLGIDLKDVPWIQILGALLGIKLGGDAIKGGIRTVIARRACKRQK